MVSAEASHLQLGIRERQGDVLFYTHYSTMKDMPGYTNSQGYQLPVYVDVVRHYLGQDWVPHEIGVELTTVPRAVEELFPNCRIQTNQPVGYIAVPRSRLHVAASSPDRGDGDHAPLVLASRFDYVDTLEALLRTYMEGGYPSAKKAAQLMDTSERTLARRLSERGLTYQEVVDHVRFEKARVLLRGSDARIGDIARAVGFKDPTHFARMFRRIGGLSPGQFRRSLRGAGDPALDPSLARR
jgi:AraC-like DNA-binding protein